MPHTETRQEVFTYFDDKEADAIEEWLKCRGYEWDMPTLCGSCCGFWTAEYYVALAPQHISEFNEWAAAKEFQIHATQGGIHIT